MSEKLETFNRGRQDQNGVYLISTATPYRPYYALWRKFKEYQYPLFIRSLSVTFDSAITRAIQLLNNCNIALTLANEKEIDECYCITEDIIPFGKYKGKHIAEIYYIDPGYVLWLANKFEPHNKRYEIIKTYAHLFSIVNFELNINKANISSTSKFVGHEGERLKDLFLSVLNVKLQIDTYKPDFYVDQNVLAADKDGNRFIFFIKAKGRSLSSEQLSCHSRRIEKHEVLHILSAKVMKHFSKNGVEYTKIGYLKIE